MHVAFLYGIQVHVTKKRSPSDVFGNLNQVCCAFVYWYLLDAVIALKYGLLRIMTCMLLFCIQTSENK